MQEEETLIQEFLDRFIYVTKGDLVYDCNVPRNYAITKFTEFKRTYSNYFIKIKTQKGSRKINLPKMWIEHPARTTADRVEYYPNKPYYYSEDDLYCVNTYQPGISKPEVTFEEHHNSCDLVFDHLSYLFPKKDELEWFISWMAFCVQKPERRSKVTPLHISTHHGTGRGWIVKLLEKLLGPQNCTKTKMSALYESDYQNFMKDSVLCCIEEVREPNKKFSICDQIRDFLTEDRLEINMKYGERKTIRVFTNFLFFSNHLDAIALTHEDRRINVFYCPHKPREIAYYKYLYEWLETTGVDAFYDYLSNISIEDFNWFTSFSNDARSNLIENSQNLIEQAFHTLIATPPARALTFRQVMAEINRCLQDFGSTEYANEKQVIKLLQTHCKKAQAIKVNNTKVRPWYLKKEQNLLPLNKLRDEIYQLHLSRP